MMRAGVIVAALLLAVVAFALLEWGPDLSPLEAWIEQRPFMGAGAYVLALAVSVVLLPLSSLPLVPFAAGLYGVWVTGVLSAAGWWIGSLIAFQIARLGRRYLERITTLEAVDRLERRIPQDIGFWGMVTALMIFPTDVVSFALGLLRELRFRTFAVASLIGILPFSFVWAYAGGQLEAGKFVAFAAAAVGMAVAVLVIRRLWKRRSLRQ